MPRIQLWCSSKSGSQLKSKCLIFMKSRGQKYLFLFWHTYFFAQLGPTGKKSVNTAMDICVIRITHEEEEGAEQLALELWLRYRPAALHCVKWKLLQFSLFSQQRAATQALCMTLPKARVKHTWDREGAGAGHPRLLTQALVLAAFQFVFQGRGFHG